MTQQKCRYSLSSSLLRVQRPPSQRKARVGGRKKKKKERKKTLACQRLSKKIMPRLLKSYINTYLNCVEENRSTGARAFLPVVERLTFHTKAAHRMIPLSSHYLAEAVHHVSSETPPVWECDHPPVQPAFISLSV